MTTTANKQQNTITRSKFQTSLILIVSTLLISMVLAISAYTYQRNAKTTLEISDELMFIASCNVIEKTTNYLLPAQQTPQTTAGITDGSTDQLRNDEHLALYLRKSLALFPHLSMSYIANPEGTMVMAFKKRDGSIGIKRIWAEQGKMLEQWQNTDEKSIKKAEAAPSISEYDPRRRIWYKGALKRKKEFWSDLYVFHTGNTLGITASYPTFNPDGSLKTIIGADISLENLSSFIATLHIGERGKVFIINDKNDIVAYPSKKKQIIRNIADIGDSPEAVACLKFNDHQKKAFSFNHKEERYLARFNSFPAKFAKDWKIVIVVPEDDFVGKLKESQLESLAISLAILITGIFITSFVAKSISRPIVLITEETERIKNFDLSGTLETNSRIKEIAQITQAIASMKLGLSAFRKYAPATLVRQLIDTGAEAKLGGVEKEVTIFFSDITNFTSIAERYTPRNLMLHLSEYFTEMSAIITEEGGTVDKYIGDSIMAFWGAPLEKLDHANSAARAAVRCQKRLAELNLEWKRTKGVCFSTRIGLHTGKVIVGNIGSEERMNYTIIGDNVNLASRLEGINKVFGTSILMSDSTYKEVFNSCISRPVGIFSVKGKKERQLVHELCDYVTGENEARDSFSSEFSRAFQLYLLRKWKEALDIFTTLSSAKPHDIPLNLYLVNCKKFLKNEPSEHWHGIVKISEQKIS